MLDPKAIHFALVLYRLWRLRRWQRRARNRKAEEARTKALYSLPQPKHWPRQSRIELQTLDGRPAPKRVQDAFLRIARHDQRLPTAVRELARCQHHVSRLNNRREK